MEGYPPLELSSPSSPEPPQLEEVPQPEEVSHSEESEQSQLEDSDDSDELSPPPDDLEEFPAYWEPMDSGESETVLPSTENDEPENGSQPSGSEGSSEPNSRALSSSEESEGYPNIYTFEGSDTYSLPDTFPLPPEIPESTELPKPEQMRQELPKPTKAARLNRKWYYNGAIFDCETITVRNGYIDPLSEVEVQIEGGWPVMIPRGHELSFRIEENIIRNFPLKAFETALSALLQLVRGFLGLIWSSFTLPSLLCFPYHIPFFPPAQFWS